MKVVPYDPKKSAAMIEEGAHRIRGKISRLSQKDRRLFRLFINLCNPIKSGYNPERAIKKLPDVRAILESLDDVPAPTADEIPDEYSPKLLRSELGISDQTLHDNAVQAGVDTPTRGKKNFKFKLADVKTIARWIIRHSLDGEAVSKAKTLLGKLDK